ncbi:PTH2 [Mytilus edulis]|uniref:peptidyl-tRNA hydrolase n=1 Tax=Mytilus edulis TaxID=6550 RepID=A0A8S3U458_MYTED|nr:PTH2 [Mytilus edulis]
MIHAPFSCILLSCLISISVHQYCSNFKDMDSASGGDNGNEESATTSEGGFKPRDDHLAVLMSLGFSKNAATRGLYYTGNYNADLAAAWIIENEDKDINAPFEADAEDSDDSEDDYIPDGVDFYKMVFVVNSEFSMGVGKVAAQVAHSALGLHRVLLENPQKYGQMLMSWEQFGETKIVVKGDNTSQLLGLAAKANTMDLPNYLVQDAGRTQIEPGSITCLGIMGKIDQVDSVTGSLKLL